MIGFHRSLTDPMNRPQQLPKWDIVLGIVKLVYTKLHNKKCYRTEQPKPVASMILLKFCSLSQEWFLDGIPDDKWLEIQPQQIGCELSWESGIYYIGLHFTVSSSEWYICSCTHVTKLVGVGMRDLSKAIHLTSQLRECWNVRRIKLASNDSLNWKRNQIRFSFWLILITTAITAGTEYNYLPDGQAYSEFIRITHIL